jgi:hypothetical protein
MNYLVADLQAGASWAYQAPHSHNIVWAFVFEGRPTVLGETSHRELLVFAGDGAIEFKSTSEPSRILLGSGRRHEYPLVLGSSSVHTNKQSLVRGQERIEELAMKLRKSSRLT